MKPELEIVSGFSFQIMSEESGSKFDRCLPPQMSHEPAQDLISGSQQPQSKHPSPMLQPPHRKKPSKLSCSQSKQSPGPESSQTQQSKETPPDSLQIMSEESGSKVDHSLSQKPLTMQSFNKPGSQQPSKRIRPQSMHPSSIMDSKTHSRDISNSMLQSKSSSFKSKEPPGPENNQTQQSNETQLDNINVFKSQDSVKSEKRLILKDGIKMSINHYYKKKPQDHHRTLDLLFEFDNELNSKIVGEFFIYFITLPVLFSLSYFQKWPILERVFQMHT